MPDDLEDGDYNHHPNIPRHSSKLVIVGSSASMRMSRWVDEHISRALSPNPHAQATEDAQLRAQ